jgi:hypothetical protein
MQHLRKKYEEQFEMRSTNECLLRLAMRADNGYTPLKLNEQNVENNVRRCEYLGGKQPYMENSQRILPGGGGETKVK